MLSRLLLLLLLCSCANNRPGGISDDDDAADDDSSDDDDSAAGVAPVIESVDFCERSLAVDDCDGFGDETTFSAAARLTLSDLDGDLQNFDWSLELVGPPAFTGILEGDLGEGGVLQINTCNTWVRGSSLPYTAIVWDAAGHASAAVSGSWDIPAVSGDDSCP